MSSEEMIKEIKKYHDQYKSICDQYNSMKFSEYFLKLPTLYFTERLAKLNYGDIASLYNWWKYFIEEFAVHLDKLINIRTEEYWNTLFYMYDTATPNRELRMMKTLCEGIRLHLKQNRHKFTVRDKILATLKGR